MKFVAQMRSSSVQFAPLQRAQAVPAPQRHSQSENSFAASARYVGITWKVILLFWLLFLAALYLQG
jgi:hypothetical protein